MLGIRIMERLPTESGTNTRTIPLTLPAAQTFDGTSTTACSQTDYLYGSASNTAGDATATVSATNATPTVYLQHALAQLVFTIEYKPVDACPIAITLM